VRIKKKSVKPPTNANERKSFEQLLAATSGIWRGGDGLKYQQSIRKEWAAAGRTVESTVEYNPHMQTIQVVLEEKLLKDTDRVVKRTKTNRSALIREALREHLKRVRERELDEQERRSYEKCPQTLDETEWLERAAVWPD